MGSASTATGLRGYAPRGPVACVQSTKKIVCFGDSITWGAGSSDLGGYRSRLYNLAATQGKILQFVGTQLNGPAFASGVLWPRGCEGYPGWAIADTPFPQEGITKLVPTPALSASPDIVLLMIGINDNVYAPWWSTMINRLDTLVGLLVTNAPSAWIVVGTLCPWNFPSYNLSPPYLTAYCQAIPGMVATRAGLGQKVRSVDFQVLTLADLADEVHPNDGGYEKMANIWWAAIRDLV
jgi:lysophospholipase L1-like esterase